MSSLKKLINLRANSLLESVIALSIISICLYLAVVVYTNVFSPKTSIQAYSNQNKMSEMFFLLQLKHDSIIESTDNKWNIQEETDGALVKLELKYNDSINTNNTALYFIKANE